MKSSMSQFDLRNTWHSQPWEFNHERHSKQYAEPFGWWGWNSTPCPHKVGTEPNMYSAPWHLGSSPSVLRVHVDRPLGSIFLVYAALLHPLSCLDVPTTKGIEIPYNYSPICPKTHWCTKDNKNNIRNNNKNNKLCFETVMTVPPAN